MKHTYDIIIIGAGIIGTATAKFLSEYHLDVLVVDAAADVACGATKANSGILHAGYDCVPGTLKAKLNIEGISMYRTLVQQLEIPHTWNGSLVIAPIQDTHMETSPPQAVKNTHNQLHALYERGLKNGVPDMALLSAEEAMQLEPNLNKHISGALWAKTAGIISPYEAAIAFAENAAAHDVAFSLETFVSNISYADACLHNITGMTHHKSDLEKIYCIATSKGNFYTPMIINASGINSGNLNNMINETQETILAQRGEYYLLDNTQKNLVTRTIFQCPTNLGKGVLVAPTVDHNVLLGPTAIWTDDAHNASTTTEGLSEVLTKAAMTLKNTPIRDRITAFSGIRAKHKSEDFIINEPQPGFINALGIDSPGLSSAPAIGKRLADMALAHFQPKRKIHFQPYRAAIRRLHNLAFEEQSEIVAQNPAYGNIICRCETVSEAEIIDAIHRNPGAYNLDALKRRTRAQGGRCQGGFCTTKLMEILAREQNMCESDVTKNGQGTQLVT